MGDEEAEDQEGEGDQERSEEDLPPRQRQEAPPQELEPEAIPGREGRGVEDDEGSPRARPPCKPEALEATQVVVDGQRTPQPER